MQAKELLQMLKHWGNYKEALRPDAPFEMQVVNEELKLEGLTLRCVDRRMCIEVVLVKRGYRDLRGQFVPGNIQIGVYRYDDPIWQAKAVITALKSSPEGVVILTALVKEFYCDEEGRVFLNNMVETLKSENRLEELSRIVTARMMMMNI